MRNTGSTYVDYFISKQSQFLLLAESVTAISHIPTMNQD